MAQCTHRSAIPGRLYGARKGAAVS
jgi:hypothetical protein